MHKFSLPLLLDPDGARCGYGRLSDAYVDSDGLPVLIIDPSEGEYAACCTEEQAAQFILCANAHDDLVAALKSAARLAWEVGCETEDGVMTLLEDSRGDLYRQISAALAKAGEP